ncbi:MAG TPA: LCP family protein [Fimbriimonas sp.]|nr:LCP family protein [Fimbriimonas sp.]
MREKRPQRPKWLRVLGGIAYVLFLVCVLSVASFAGWMKQSPLVSEMIKGAIVGHPTPKQEFGKDSVTLLVLGCDSDYTTGGGRITRKYSRSDMMLVAKLDFANKRITGVSIPRDTECRLPGYRAMKINAYHAISKESEADQLSKEAVEFLLPGVTIDRVVTLDFEAFQKMVDMLGGVNVDVEKRMAYNDRAGHLKIDLQAGPQKLTGYEAMGYVRFRHNDSDFKRQDRQKQFLLAVKQEMLKPENLKSLPQIIEQGKQVLNGALDDKELASLMFFAKEVKPESIKLGQIPVIESAKSTNLLVDEEKLPQTLTEYGLVGA